MPSASPVDIHSSLVARKSVPLRNCPLNFNSNAMQSNIIIVIALVLSIASAATLSDKKRHSFQTHNRMLRRYGCELPQPRVFEMEELHNNEELLKHISAGRKDYIHPHVTVLHRCQGAGCCENPNERCMPIDDEVEEVTLTFSLANGRLQYINVKEMNHTRCACNSDYDNDIK